jgi:hypothetical protein
MSTSVDTGPNLFNFIHEHFLQICVRKVAVYLQKVLEEKHVPQLKES